MNYPSVEFEDAVSEMCHGTISDEVLEDLSLLLKRNQDAMDDYLWRLEVHGHLGSTFESMSAKRRITHRRRKRQNPYRLFKVAASIAAVIALSFGLLFLTGELNFLKQGPSTTAQTSDVTSSQPIIGQITHLNNAIWMTPATRISRGQAIRRNQSLELSDGIAVLKLNSSATIKFAGPAILRPLSDNSVFLSMGRASVIADTPESKGFALLTPQSKFVDVGTEFTVTADSDGQSTVIVEKGEVNAYVGGTDKAIPVLEGGSLQIARGKNKLITRVEAGSRTSAYQFPTLPPPSDRDYADLSHGNARFFVRPEALSKHGSPKGVSILQDGISHANPKSGMNAVIFTGHHFLVVDLGKKVPIREINTYTWSEYSKTKARQSIFQKIKLFGYTGDKHFTEANIPDWQEALDEDWVQITEVLSRQYFNGPMRLDIAQQASSITSATGEIGAYRYLIFQTHGRSHYGEIDIFIK